jgi:hypothetical protein
MENKQQRLPQIANFFKNAAPASAVVDAMPAGHGSRAAVHGL